MNELRAGGLALIIDSAKPEDIGKCVTTLRLIPANGSFDSPRGRATKNHADFSAWLVSGDVEAPIFGAHPAWAARGWSLYPPQYLMPIDGMEESPDVEQQKETEHG